MPSLMISPFQLASMQDEIPTEPFSPASRMENQAGQSNSGQSYQTKAGNFKKERGSNVDLVKEL